MDIKGGRVIVAGLNRGICIAWPLGETGAQSVCLELIITMVVSYKLKVNVLVCDVVWWRCGVWWRGGD